MKKTIYPYILAISSACHIAAAQPAGDKVTAEALFDTAKLLLEDAKYAEACHKFSESQRLDPAPGTLLNLADCYEKWGRTASAWATWLDAAASARAAGQTDRERAARDRASALKSRLVTITIDVPDQNRVNGMEIRRDDAEVGIAVWATAVPVDPGTHTITATAPRHQAWKTTVTVVDGVQPVHVRVPLLELEGTETEVPSGSPAAPPPVSQLASYHSGALKQAPSSTGNTPAGRPQPEKRGSRQATWGYVVGGMGVIGLGISAALGLKARAINAESKSYCQTDVWCDARGNNLRQDALGYATNATIAFGIGLSALVAGVALLATAPSATERPPTVAPARWGLNTQ